MRVKRVSLLILSKSSLHLEGKVSMELTDEVQDAEHLKNRITMTKQYVERCFKSDKTGNE